VEIQFAQLFERHGVEFVGSTRVHTEHPATDVAIHGRPSYHAPQVSSMHTLGAELTVQQLRETHDVVILATGLGADKPLPIPDAGSTQAPSSGPIPHRGLTTTGVGNGNVAMDIVRVLAITKQQLASSDIDEPTHAGLTQRLTTINIIGRSAVAQAKFDTVMLREILDLPGINHTVSGIAPEEYAVDDPRTALIAQLAERPCHDDARLTINWYFGHTPQHVVANDDTVTGLAVASSQGSRLINADS